MKHYAMARTEFFEAAALIPSGSVPESASPDGGGEAESEAEANVAKWSDRARLRKNPGKTGLNSTCRHSAPLGATSGNGR